MQKQPNSRMCFVCGVENSLGLKLFFYTDDEGRCITRFRPREEHQGYPGHLHGGVISTLLDETMGRVLMHENVFALTGRLEFKFRKPVPLDQELTVVGELTRNRSGPTKPRARSGWQMGRCWWKGRGSTSGFPMRRWSGPKRNWSSGRLCRTR